MLLYTPHMSYQLLVRMIRFRVCESSFSMEEEVLRTVQMSILLKYGLCKKLLRYKWTSEQLNTFFLTFWLVCCVTSQKVRKKVFNWSDAHVYRRNFLQNPYFRELPILYTYALDLVTVDSKKRRFICVHLFPNLHTFWFLVKKRVKQHLPY